MFKVVAVVAVVAAAVAVVAVFFPSLSLPPQPLSFLFCVSFYPIPPFSLSLSLSLTFLFFICIE